MTNIKEDIFNTQKSEKFVSKLIDIINFGSLNIMISIGYRTGLFIDMLEKAGCTSIEVKELPHDPINYYYIVQK